MKTSYFGNPAMKDSPAAVSIARNPPRTWGPGRRYFALAPSKDLLDHYKAGLPWEEYVREYNAYLGTLDPRKVWGDLSDKVLCCWEKPGERCHRRLVAEWLLRGIGVEVGEVMV